MNTRLHYETLCCPNRVEAMLASDTDLYETLGSALRKQQVQGVVTLAHGSDDHIATYFSYLVMAHLRLLATPLTLTLPSVCTAAQRTPHLLALGIAQFSNTPRMVQALQSLRHTSATTLALVNRKDVACGDDLAAWVMPVHAGVEESMAAAKAFICSLVSCARIVAHWRNEVRLLRALHGLPMVLDQASQQNWNEAVDVLSHAKRLVVVGQGASLAVAQEAARVFTQICDLPTHVLDATALLQGHSAEIIGIHPVLLFAPRGHAQQRLLALSNDLRSRGLHTLVVAPADVAERELTLCTAGHSDLDPIAAMQSFYLLADRVAYARGIDTDSMVVA